MSSALLQPTYDDKRHYPMGHPVDGMIFTVLLVYGGIALLLGRAPQVLGSALFLLLLLVTAALCRKGREDLDRLHDPRVVVPQSLPHTALEWLLKKYTEFNVEDPDAWMEDARAVHSWLVTNAIWMRRYEGEITEREAGELYDKNSVCATRSMREDCQWWTPTPDAIEDVERLFDPRPRRGDRNGG